MIIKFETYYDGEFWCARGIGASVFTQGKSYDKLLANLREAAALHFEDEIKAGEKLQLRNQISRDDLIKKLC